MRNLHRSLVVAIVAIGSLALVACNGDGGDTSGTSDGSPGATADLAAAQAIVDGAQPPTAIQATVESSEPLPTGADHTIAYIHCGQAGCAVGETAVRDAIDGMGLDWTVKVIPTDGSPESIQTAWTSALRLDPSAIYACCFDESLVPDQLAEAQSRGIPVFDSYSLAESGENFFTLGGEADLTGFGETMAGWVVSQTEGEANVLFIELLEFPPLVVVSDKFHAKFAELCPDCTVHDETFAISDIGATGPSKVVSYLRANPDVNYVVFNYDGIGTGVPAALEAAGLDVPTVGQSPDSTSIGYVQAGQQSATVTQGYFEMWTGVVDATARVISGQDVDPNELRMPTWLYTKDSPADATGADGPVVPGLYDGFLALWPS